MKRSIARLAHGRLTDKRLTEHAEIDLILSREQEILPSSGFAVLVMNAVRRESQAPPPIPFPWKRALPGVLVGGFALALVLIAIAAAILQADKAAPPQFSVSLLSGMPPLFHGGIESAAIWTVLALLAVLVSVKLSMRLASGAA
jgi:hypothetical protein